MYIAVKTVKSVIFRFPKTSYTPSDLQRARATLGLCGARSQL
jgi:hypothetical protein